MFYLKTSFLQPKS